MPYKSSYLDEDFIMLPQHFTCVSEFYGLLRGLQEPKPDGGSKMLLDAFCLPLSFIGAKIES